MINVKIISKKISRQNMYMKKINKDKNLIIFLTSFNLSIKIKLEISKNYKNLYFSLII